MKKILFIGSKKIGFKCLKIIFENQKKNNFFIGAVLTNDKGNDIKKFCIDNNIFLMKDLDEILVEKSFDIGISVQYHKILNINHINSCKDIFINLHMAPLPEYRGCNQFSYAIINKDKEFGTTIHKMDTGIDSGPILFERRFEIPHNCWVNDLYEITYKESIELFKNSIQKIISGDYKLTNQENLLNKRSSSFQLRQDIEKIKNINLSWSREKIERYIRATYMPEFSPPFFFVNDEKIEIIKKDK